MMIGQATGQCTLVPFPPPYLHLYLYVGATSSLTRDRANTRFLDGSRESGCEESGTATGVGVWII